MPLPEKPALAGGVITSQAQTGPRERVQDALLVSVDWAHGVRSLDLGVDLGILGRTDRLFQQAGKQRTAALIWTRQNSVGARQQLSRKAYR